ncbi:MAG: sigma-70 family RNA polymerase sigma factor [Pseudomonadota bacterium]
MPADEERWIVVKRAHAAGASPAASAVELARRFQRGDVAAFEELARPLLDMLYTFSLRVVGNEQEAEDIAQEALIRALRNHRRFDPERPFKPYLMRITLNLCRDRLRTVWWSRVLPMNQAPHEVAPGPELITEAAERDAKVRHALSTLPRKYREAVSLFHLDDMSYAEMSEVTGTKVPALKQRVRRGLGMLDEALTRLYPELVEGRRSGDPGADR